MIGQFEYPHSGISITQPVNAAMFF